MKKSKLLMIPAVVVSAAFGVMVSNLDSVSAANNECSAAYNDETYMDKIKITQNGGTATLTNVSSNLYYIVAYSDSNGDRTDETKHQVDATGTFTVEVPVDGKVYLSFGLVNDDGVCAADTSIGMKTIEYPTSGRNSMYDSAACTAYRNDFSNNKTMREAVSYCFEEYVSIQYPESDVLAWINAARDSYNYINDDATIEGDPSYKNVDNVNEEIKLTCDLFRTGNYETMHKYSHTETDNSNNCKVTCREDIEVNFSDPVATQAGLCFQYLIEIKSKVDCTAKYTAPLPTPKTACVETPICTQANGHQSDLGGPNEDFDACVKECDGGKYSQKCIDSCYEEVYENNDGKKKVSNQNNSTLPTFMFDDFILPVENSYLTQVKDSKGCITVSEMIRGVGTAQEIYEQQQNNPGGYYKNGTWVPDKDGCNPELGQYYFSTVSKTAQTLRELRGQTSIYWYGLGYMQHWYGAGGNGFLKRTNAILGHTCLDKCVWTNKCGSNKVASQTQANKEYQEALKEYNEAKRACEQKAVTCTNERTDYKIVVDNPDTNPNNGNDKETFESYQNLNSNKVQGDFPDMVTLTSGECEGNNDGWDYHNIITFPGTWINNKTGQTVHSMDPGYEDFYTYVGNEYCTKLNSVPINTAWYDWKVNQNGNPDALTDSEKEEMEENIEMNIHGKIENYGYFGWNFDVGCFYAIGEPETSCPPSDPDYPNCDDPDPSCPPDDPDYPNCDGGGGDDDDGGGGGGDNESPINAYDFRSVALDNMFPNSIAQTSQTEKDIQASNLINTVETMKNNKAATTVADTEREIGFNWTCAATNLENPDYIVQPVTVLNQIQALGDSIYNDERYLDYHVKLTPETMRKIRNYNDKYDSYAEPTSDNSSEVLNAGSNKTAGITVYKSYLLHKVLNKGTELVKSGVIGCNNEDDGSCPNTIDTTTSCYHEYMAQSAVLKGAK